MTTSNGDPGNMPCSTLGCRNPVSLAKPLQCPLCLQDPELEPSYYHSQECFKSSYKDHKIQYHTPPTVEPDYKGPAGTYDPFSAANRPHFARRARIKLDRDDSNFAYTGPLRACYPIKAVRQRTTPEHMALPDYAKDVILGESRSEQAVAQLRLGRVLKLHEIDGMRVVCRLSREVLDGAASHIRPGITSLELDKIVHDLCLERDAYPSPLGYHRFPRSVCISINEVVCHGIPDARPLQEGDIVNLDVSLFHNGFHGDINGTYPVGKISAEAEHLITNTRRCLDRAIAICAPGTLYREVGRVIEPLAKQNGLTVNKRYVGHGINELFHAAPSIAHYADNKTPGEMKKGQCFTIEPMVNAGDHRDYHWPDNWTCVTKDGKPSAQFEETLLITENGVEVLTGAPGWVLPEEFRRFAKGKVTNGNVGEA